MRGSGDLFGPRDLAATYAVDKHPRVSPAPRVPNFAWLIATRPITPQGRVMVTSMHNGEKVLTRQLHRSYQGAMQERNAALQLLAAGCDTS